MLQRRLSICRLASNRLLNRVPKSTRQSTRRRRCSASTTTIQTGRAPTGLRPEVVGGIRHICCFLELLLLWLASTNLDPFDIMLSYNAWSGNDLPRRVGGYGDPRGSFGWTAIGITYSVRYIVAGEVACWCADFSHGGEWSDKS